MKTRSQGNRWLEGFWGGLALLLAPMLIAGLIFFIPAVIHASYAWHTFYGSNGEASGERIVLDESGNVYVAGHCDAPWQGDGGENPLHPHSGGIDIVVMKLDPNGAYQWHTFYGGSDSDGAYGIALDGSGNVFISGWSSSSWQGDGGADPLHPHSEGANEDIVVVKLDNNGVYQWHTFYGSSDYDGSGSIALDGGGNIYVAGTSKGSWQGDGDASPLHGYNGLWDIVVLKLGNDGSYQWHTFYGSSSYDGAAVIALGEDGSLFIAGTSEGSWQGDGGVNPLHPYSGDRDIAVIKLNSSGDYQWHTFYGSSGYEQVYGIAPKGNGKVHVTGVSWATWLGDGDADPVHPHSEESNPDIFAMKLNGNGNYQWHTFYGSSEGDFGKCISVDESGNVYIAGSSSGSWQGDGGANPLHSYGGGWDIVVVKLHSSGAYQWHTFYGTGDQDWASGVTVDGYGNVHVAGESKAAWQGDGGENPIHAHSGGGDIAVLKLYGEGPNPQEGTIGTQITITRSGFGTKKGKVLIGGVATKIGSWTDTAITAVLKKSPPLGVYDVALQLKQPRGAAPITFPNSFSIMAPDIGQVEPSGLSLEENTILGSFFGTKKGKVYLEDPVTGKKKNCKVTFWSMDKTTGESEARFLVPKSTKAFLPGPYLLKVSNRVGVAETTFTLE